MELEDDMLRVSLRKEVPYWMGELGTQPSDAHVLLEGQYLPVPRGKSSVGPSDEDRRTVESGGVVSSNFRRVHSPMPN